MLNVPCEASSVVASGIITILIVFSKILGSCKSILNPPSPNLFSGFNLAAYRVLESSANSVEVMVLAPSSATLLAAPGSSISMMTSD